MGGGSLGDLNRRSKLTKDTANRIFREVETHYLGCDPVFWDGPYSAPEAAQVAQINEGNRAAFDRFAKTHAGEQFFITFRFWVLDGFTAHGSERASGYRPDSIFVPKVAGPAEWVSIEELNISAPPTDVSHGSLANRPDGSNH